MNRFLITFSCDNTEKSLNNLTYLSGNNFDKTTIIIIGESISYAPTTKCELINITTNNIGQIVDYLLTIINAKDYVFLDSNDNQNELANMLAIKLNTRCLLNCIEVKQQDNMLLATKNIYSNYLFADYDITGGCIVTLKVDGVTNLAKGSFDNITKSVVYDAKTEDKQPFKLIKREVKQQNNLAKADLVVIAGKGVKKDKLQSLVKLTNLIGGEIGATRPVTYEGVIPIDRMVGSSNISVSPKLLITVGVSGSAPLLCGIKNSKKIISINNDRRAMIFNHSNIAIVMDSTKFIDTMLKKLEVTND